MYSFIAVTKYLRSSLRLFVKTHLFCLQSFLPAGEGVCLYGLVPSRDSNRCLFYSTYQYCLFLFRAYFGAVCYIARRSKECIYR